MRFVSFYYLIGNLRLPSTSTVSPHLVSQSRGIIAPNDYISSFANCCSSWFSTHPSPGSVVGMENGRRPKRCADIKCYKAVRLHYRLPRYTSRDFRRIAPWRIRSGKWNLRARRSGNRGRGRTAGPPLKTVEELQF